jgi:predicted alpha/beta superfamily hydrolase
MMQEGAIEGVLVVGIWNTPLRYREYMPQQALVNSPDRTWAQRFAREKGGAPLSDAYLRFMVEELKPFVDRRFNTRPEPEFTCVMGSSMGGLVSLYALESYPDIFGGAACLSTHWTIGGSSLVEAMGNSLPRPERHRIYFDRGTLGQEAQYAHFQHQMDSRMIAAGFTAGRNWLSRQWEGHDHSERAWRARVDVPLRFLLRPPGGDA